MSDFSPSNLGVKCPSCNELVPLKNVNTHLDYCVEYDTYKKKEGTTGFNENTQTNNGYNNNNNNNWDNNYDNQNTYNNKEDSCSDDSDKDYWNFGDDDTNENSKQNNSNNNYNDNSKHTDDFPDFDNSIYSRDYNPGNNNNRNDDFKSEETINYNNYNSNNNNNNNNNNISKINESRPLTIVAIGKTGSGKSTILNRFRGDVSDKGDQGPFKAKGGGKSVTQIVQSSTQNFNFKQKELRCYNSILCQLIDTPGLADSGGNEEKLVNEVRKFFQQVCTGVHVFIITFNVTNVRYDTNIQNLLHLLTQLFGKEFWRHVMIVFTRHDEYSNHKIHKEEYQDCMSQYPQKIKKQFNLNFEICSTGIGKNNYIKSIKDILKFGKSRGIFECQYMKSWKEAGGIGNPQQRKQKENELILAMANQERKYRDEIVKLEKKLKIQLDEQKREKQEWQKQLSNLKDSQQLIRQVEMDQKRKNRDLENKIKDLQRQQQQKKRNNGGVGGFLQNLLGLAFPNSNDDDDNKSCLIM